jgi:hypothetical protein
VEGGSNSRDKKRTYYSCFMVPLRDSNLWKFSRIDEYLGWFADLLRLAGGRGDGPVGVNLVDPPVQLMQPGGREDVVLGPGVAQLVHRRPGLTQKKHKFGNLIESRTDHGP